MSDETLDAETVTEEPVVTDEQVEAPDQEAEASEPEQEAETPEPDSDKPKRETAAERRDRDKQYKARLKDEAAAARKDADAAETRRKRVLDAGAAEQAPVERDFQDYAEFEAARAYWLFSQKATKREAEAATSEVEQARQRERAARDRERAVMQREWNTQATEAKARYADFDAVISAPDLFPKGTHLPDLIMTSDSAADLAYAVARDRNLHDSLLSMSPVEAARELGRMEMRLSAPKPRLETNAPQPISPVRPKAAVAVDPGKMSPNEYAKWRASGGTHKL